MLRTVLDSALLLHGHISDDLYVFAVKQEYKDLNSIQKAREMYTFGLRAHKKSSSLYLEAFKIELAYSEVLTQKVLKSGTTHKPINFTILYSILYIIVFFFFNVGKEFSLDDPALNGSISKVIFESAVENIKDDYSLYFKMFNEATKYNFALYISSEIKK